MDLICLSFALFDLFYTRYCLVIPVASAMFSLRCWMFLIKDSGKEWSCMAPVGLGPCFMPLVFRQDYRIPVNRALTGNDLDCRISDY